ncbi:MAG: hypothetical protein A3D35_02810 [Candidatus Staskawiczbacteria bacterium RIFCSPHIGHO2_02_FULL_34_9]|uniref:Type 4 fimbrial biogenesis protein PilX N-terminal domain-containing protein n=1 Tax=Candidatus Staskawiczbacteria bacterium RIFCSPHIGHO2_02_FULL_34_9 TaxID=1802206 RepID=A0A1G2HX71_9BACT|nr:MAG: hypothetical protein A3D35_02810 [Candidatus Staskawiczbacteria bacterium RIFCSPHIGHO2_02_FULL_34_9]
MLIAYKKQKGVSLIIVFFTMTILLVTLLSISTILFNEVKIVSNASNAVSSFYASNSGIEKTLYYARKQIPAGGYTGVCNICNACNSSDCQNCVTAPLASGGCDLTTCNNCQVTYQSSFDNRTYLVDATISPDSNPAYSVLSISSKGVYNNTARTLSVTQKIGLPSSNGITRVQSGNMGQSHGSTANFIWPSLTTAGNTLIIIASVTHNQGQAITRPITPPIGWSTAISYTGNSVTTSIFYISGAGLQTSTGSFTSPIDSNRTEWAIIGIEYSGVLSPASLDKTASNGVLSTTVTTGITAITTQADEIWVAGIGNEANLVSSPTNGFSIVDTNSNFMGLTALEKSVTTTGQASTGGTVPNGVTSGVIATFKAGPSSPPPPPILLVQKSKNTGASSVSAIWPNATTAGNLLVAVVSNGRDSGNQGNVNGPTGWIRAVSTNYSQNGGPRISIFYRYNAPSQTSTGNFTASGAGEAMSIVVAEYAGVLTSNPLDKTKSFSNQLTAYPVTGTTQPTIQSYELVIGAIGSRGGNATDPTNGFSIVDQMNQGGNAGNAILLQRLVYYTGPYVTGVHTASSNQAAGVIATFKMAP